MYKLITEKEGVRLSAHKQKITDVTGTSQEQHKNNTRTSGKAEILLLKSKKRWQHLQM